MESFYLNLALDAVGRTIFGDLSERTRAEPAIMYLELGSRALSPSIQTMEQNWT